VSSFSLSRDGTMTFINRVVSGQGGICWIDSHGNNIYTANNTTDNISQYTIDLSTGQLSLQPQNAAAAVVGLGVDSFPDEAFPLDLVVGNHGRTLYQLTPGPSTAPGAQIHAFSIDPVTGNLTGIGNVSVGNVPLAGQMGIATLDY